MSHSNNKSGQRKGPCRKPAGQMTRPTQARVSGRTSRLGALFRRFVFFFAGIALRTLRTPWKIGFLFEGPHVWWYVSWRGGKYSSPSQGVAKAAL